MKRRAFRTTITVPAELKDRMDKAGADVNWSALACRAFEEKLAEIATKKEKKTMADVIQRLRVLAARENDQDYKDGSKAGRRWAEGKATPRELRRLQSTRERCGAEWDRIWEGTSAAFSRGEWLYFGIHPEHDGARGYASQFWERTLGDSVDRVSDPTFVMGFADGALELWDEVENKLSD